MRAASQRGFTLLELLVVVTIVSVMTAVAGLSVTLARPAPESDSARFVALFNGARHLAVAEGRVVALRLSPQDAQRMRREDGQWVPDGPPVTWQGTAMINGERMVVVWPSDQSDPLQVEFRPRSGKPVRCTLSGVGGATCSG